MHSQRFDQKMWGNGSKVALMEMSANTNHLQRSYNELLEYKLVLEKAGEIFHSALNTAAAQQIRSQGHHNEVSMDSPLLLEQEEWRRCLKPLHVNTVAKLKKVLLELEKEVRRPSNFVEFYSYAFRYCLTEEKQKSVDIDTICQLLDLVLGSLFRAQVDYLIDFLKAQTDYKVINMDQWVGFYKFCNEVGD